MTKTVIVAAAALVSPQKGLLVAQRPKGKSMAGLWEFPGGKLEAGETPEAALRRELQEELAITVSPAHMQPLGFVSHQYENFHLTMLLYGASQWQGSPTPQENQEIQWCNAQALAILAMPPADEPLIAPVQTYIKKLCNV